MKKLTAVLLAAILLTGCGTKNENAEASETCTATATSFSTPEISPGDSGQDEKISLSNSGQDEKNSLSDSGQNGEISLSDSGQNEEISPGNSGQLETATPAPTPDLSVEAKMMYVSGSSVNVREKPTTESNRIGRTVRNSIVKVYLTENEWSYVEYDENKYGYMSAKYLSDKPMATPEPTPTPEPFSRPVTHKYNSNVDINDNVFLDALEYTGYNLKKHREDGNMWVFILGKYKEGMGYLSGLGYDYGNSTGYETTTSGMPDIERMKKNGGLVCASYVTYVYFNYLPHVAQIDTSFLTKPENPASAQSWRLAAEDWVKKGYSEKIPFTASRNSDGTVRFSSNETIPVGSIVVFKVYGAPDSNDARHVAIYAGEAGGYHWMTHVGNERGPEMITMERMGYSSTPEVPLEIITPPIKF